LKASAKIGVYTSPLGGGHYRERARGTQTWGTGAYLMAGSEIDRL
jgi:hypothetical protein